MLSCHSNLLLLSPLQLDLWLFGLFFLEFLFVIVDLFLSLAVIGEDGAGS